MKNVAEWYFSTFLGMMGMGLEWWFQSFEAHSHHSHHSYHSKFQGHSGFHSFHFGLIPSFGAHSNSFEKQKTMAICRNEKGMRDWSRMVSLGVPRFSILPRACFKSVAFGMIQHHQIIQYRPIAFRQTCMLPVNSVACFHRTYHQAFTSAIEAIFTKCSVLPIYKDKPAKLLAFLDKTDDKVLLMDNSKVCIRCNYDVHCAIK